MKILPERSRSARRAEARAFMVCALTAALAACAFDLEMPARYALVYGIADYANASGITDLTWTRNDARDMADLLASQGWTVLALRHAALQPALESDFQAAAAAIEPGDLFLFYFSGHGGALLAPGSEPAAAGGDEFILFSDSLANFALSDDGLMAHLARLPTRSRIVVIDACNSGGFIGDSHGVDMIPADYDGGMQGAPFSSLGHAFARYFANPCGSDIRHDQAVVITAAGELEFSWESLALQNGIFTHAFLDAARAGDLNKDGWITASEAYAHARRGIETGWNRSVPPAYRFLPHISAGPVDYVLFEAP